MATAAGSQANVEGTPGMPCTPGTPGTPGNTEATRTPPPPRTQGERGPDADPRALGHVAAAMAHEMRNVLNSMAIHVELIESRLKKVGTGQADTATAATRSLEVLRQDVIRADEVVESYLLAVGPHEAERRPVEVAGLLAASAARLAKAAEKRGVRMELEAAPSLSWLLDVEAVELALDALVRNAIEASPRGAAVRLSARTDEGTGIIEVEDRGEGIAEGNASQLYRLGYSTRAGHAGLGLSVARQAIKGQGGLLSLRTPDGGDGGGGGTVAHIELLLDPSEPLDADEAEKP